MCIDYTSLNKACPKDPFPLPRIDQIMDSTSGYDLLCFLDAYSGFYQIPMSREDEKNTAFITVDGLFCYVSMPHGLKNALPTFVRAMHKTFGNLIRDLVEVYVDDIIVKVKSSASLLDNLALVFDWSRLTHTKLNPDKCVFGVTAGKLLSFLVLCRGIEANPEKIRTIEAMRPPARIMDAQKLTGCLAALSRFISRLAERALMFFKLMWKSGPFVETNDTEEAFQELKRYLTSPPVMVASEPGEPLLLYIAATSEAMSMVLVAKRFDPHAPHELESSSADGSGSQDPQPMEEPRADAAAGSQSPEATMAP
jgi:dsDNA-binding SOS-regulon protein